MCSTRVTSILPEYSDPAEGELQRRLQSLIGESKAAYGSETVLRIASSAVVNQKAVQNTSLGEASDSKIVFSETDEFVWRLHNQEGDKLSHEAPELSVDEQKDETGGWSKVVDPVKGEQSLGAAEMETVPDKIIREAPVGRGLSVALKLLEDRGILKHKSVRNKKLDQKEAWRTFNHKFYGKKPGKLKQEKRMKMDQRERELNHDLFS